MSIFLFSFQIIYSQLSDYADPYSEKLLLNPSYSGLTDCNEFNLNYKINSFEHLYSLSYNTKSEKFRSGYALIILNNDQGNHSINNLNISGIYSFKVISTKTRILNTALQISYNQQNVNSSNLIFSNQIDPLTGIISLIPDEGSFESYRNIGISSGISYLSTKIRTGISFYNIDKIFIENNYNYTKPLIKIHFGKIFSVKRLFNDNLQLIPEIIYNGQREFNQIIYGFHVINNKFLTRFHVKHNINFQTVSPSITFGYKYKNIRISYSYEANINKYISVPVSQNQINVLIKFKCKEKRKSKNTIYCSNF